MKEIQIKVYCINAIHIVFYKRKLLPQAVKIDFLLCYGHDNCNLSYRLIIYCPQIYLIAVAYDGILIYRKIRNFKIRIIRKIYPAKTY